MKPSQLANALRKIASKIDRSERPSKKLVARDIQTLLRLSADDLKINPKEIVNSVNLSLEEIKAGDVSDIKSSEIDKLLDYEYSAFLMKRDNGNVRLVTAIQGEQDTIYEAPLEVFDINRAAQLLIEDMNVTIENLSD